MLFTRKFIDEDAGNFPFCSLSIIFSWFDYIGLTDEPPVRTNQSPIISSFLGVGVFAVAPVVSAKLSSSYFHVGVFFGFIIVTLM